MKNEMRTGGRICPICGKTYHEPPALSRTDNERVVGYSKAVRCAAYSGVRF